MIAPHLVADHRAESHPHYREERRSESASSKDGRHGGGGHPSAEVAGGKNREGDRRRFAKGDDADDQPHETEGDHFRHEQSGASRGNEQRGRDRPVPVLVPDRKHAQQQGEGLHRPSQR
jgi:hypothetical protein